MRLCPAFVALALVALASPAHAAVLPGGCTFTLVTPCYDESASGDDCDSAGENGAATTSVMTLSPAGLVVVSGTSRCDAFGSYEGASVGFFSGANVVVLVWDESTYGGCHTTAIVFVAGQYRSQDVGCPAGSPPNPGWGQLLP